MAIAVAGALIVSASAAAHRGNRGDFAQLSSPTGENLRVSQSGKPVFNGVSAAVDGKGNLAVGWADDSSANNEAFFVGVNIGVK